MTGVDNHSRWVADAASYDTWFDQTWGGDAARRLAPLSGGLLLRLREPFNQAGYTDGVSRSINASHIRDVDWPRSMTPAGVGPVFEILGVVRDNHSRTTTGRLLRYSPAMDDVSGLIAHVALTVEEMSDAATVLAATELKLGEAAGSEWTEPLASMLVTRGMVDHVRQTGGSVVTCG